MHFIYILIVTLIRHGKLYAIKFLNEIPILEAKFREYFDFVIEILTKHYFFVAILGLIVLLLLSIASLIFNKKKKFELMILPYLLVISILQHQEELIKIFLEGIYILIEMFWEEIDIFIEMFFKVISIFNDKFPEDFDFVVKILIEYSFFFEMLGLIVCLLLSIAYLTLNERKIIGSMQKRLGPANVGFYGLLQPIADGLKLFIKEPILPSNSNILIFLIAPILTFTLSLISWAIIPFNKVIVLSDIEFGVLYIFAISSLAVYGIIIAGWASNSKYAFLGALRSTAQMISYEVSIGLIIISALLCINSLNLNKIIIFQENIWLIIPFFPLFIMFFISILAETNRHPFDLPEAEAELVAGYNVEYSSMGFALFFIGEYGNIILMSTLAVIIFLGCWLPPLMFSNISLISNPIWFALKVSILMFGFIWVRAALPRYRYDQLMNLGWKTLLPLALGTLIFISSILISFL